jgi:hypothetical protein
VFYDYYRRKIPELEKKTANGENEAKVEKLKTNKEKQVAAN